jgi:hypothetical protein
LMTYQPERADEGHQDPKTSIGSRRCVDIVTRMVLKITPDANSCFVTNEVACVIDFVCKDPFEW